VTLPIGIRYYGSGDLSGYGQSALANVRLLLNAGIPVHWQPLDWTRHGMRPGAWVGRDGKAQPLLGEGPRGIATADAATVIQLTARPIPHDTVIAHCTPETWPQMFERGLRNIGCTAWESDRPPAHWLPLLRLADRVIVPSRHNVEALGRGLDRRPCAVPHVRRHAFTEYSPRELDEAREDLGIPRGHTVFYSINAWDPRKNLPGLIEAFARAFDADDPVTLLIKTTRHGYGAGPLYPERLARDLATQAITEAVARTRRSAPSICLHDDGLDSAGIDLVHALGDVYVSLTHGEGWGLGAFEAATQGTPVIMTAWSGQLDYLGEEWPGAVRQRLAPAPLWPPYLPSYFPSQRWAEPDIDAAAQLMRACVSDPAPMRAAAQSIRERIVDRYGEPRVLHDWLAVLE
jgi:glycosyltransferase involved in cell wall biosynthesis